MWLGYIVGEQGRHRMFVNRENLISQGQDRGFAPEERQNWSNLFPGAFQGASAFLRGGPASLGPSGSARTFSLQQRRTSDDQVWALLFCLYVRT